MHLILTLSVRSMPLVSGRYHLRVTTCVSMYNNAPATESFAGVLDSVRDECYVSACRGDVLPFVVGGGANFVLALGVELDLPFVASSP